MSKFVVFAKRYLKDESGVSALEYAGLAAAVVAGVAVLATGGYFEAINTKLVAIVANIGTGAPAPAPAP